LPLNFQKLITGFVGVDKNRKVRTAGDIKGLLNRKALKVFDEVYFTDSLISGLDLMNLGINNVLGIEKVENINDEIIKIFKDCNIKIVIIAFNDIVDSQILKEKFLKIDLKVKIIAPPLSNNWKEAISNGINRGLIEKLVNEAKLFPEGHADGKSMKVEIDKAGYQFRCNKCSLAQILFPKNHILRVNTDFERQ
jgi:hypothetical protein